ncbi:hypothetical protein HF325_004684 [Metschnikowia pulcherrima]|uniref:Uncharacterized protein n=1 Tax=Metschnikowia pulcherrima TaxID=27326 RepID=A0A8H7GPS5_9ASCO|nr:hypothetical protein HF325_004684 [Metschnikowia pulcherrima]
MSEHEPASPNGEDQSKKKAHKREDGSGSKRRKKLRKMKEFRPMRDPAWPVPKNGSANVYDATADGYVADVRIDDARVSSSPCHELRVKKKSAKVVLDPLAPDYRDMFAHKGTVLAPEEILHATRPLALNIPLKLRGILMAQIHSLIRTYCVEFTTTPAQPCSMDETALLALGMLVELWAEEEVCARDPLLFMDIDESIDLQKYAAPALDDDKSGSDLASDSGSDSDSSPGSKKDSSRWSSEESDVMSIELLESDTASDVEGERHIRRRKITEIAAVENDDTSSSDSSSSDDSTTSTDSSSSSSSDEEGSGSPKESKNDGEMNMLNGAKDGSVKSYLGIGASDEGNSLGIKAGKEHVSSSIDDASSDSSSEADVSSSESESDE